MVYVQVSDFIVIQIQIPQLIFNFEIACFLNDLFENANDKWSTLLKETHKIKHVLFVTTGNPPKRLDLPPTKIQEKKQGIFLFLAHLS